MITDVVSRRRRRIYRQRRTHTATDATVTRICNYMAILLVLLCMCASMSSPNITEEYWYLAMIARRGNIGKESHHFRNRQAHLPKLGWQYRVAYALWVTTQS
eukprot:5344947-Pleurochrysis_carterae.AAC.1